MATRAIGPATPRFSCINCRLPEPRTCVPVAHPDQPPRREARSNATTRDAAQSVDLRPGRPEDSPLRREPRADTSQSLDLRARVERVQQATGQRIGEHRPPVTSKRDLTRPAYTPPPSSPPRPAPPQPASARPDDQSHRPPLGAYPSPGTAEPSTQDVNNRPAGRSTETQPAAQPWRPEDSVDNRSAQAQPSFDPRARAPEPEWPQHPPMPQTGPPNWGASAQWPGAVPGPASPGSAMPGSGQSWAGAPAPAWVQPVRKGGSGIAPWGIKEIALIVVGGVLLTIALLFGAIAILEGIGRDSTDATDPVVFLAFGVTMYLGFGGAIWAVLIAWRHRTLADLGFRRTKLSSILWMIPLAVGVLAIVSVVGVLQDTLFGITPPEDSGLPLEEGNVNAGGIIAAALVAVILAPLFEELFFRGVLFQYLRSRYLLVARGLFEAVVISALAFASLHLGGAILPILPVGIILALVMHRTNSLWPAIALHVFYNGLVLVISITTLSSGVTP